jgi:catechol 2,3-dioxygenase-like lactoylglutathione lyase family enzyme
MMIGPLDHVSVAVPNLGPALDWFERATGVRPIEGGAHRAMGTHNALVGLGDAVYLEILASDPAREADSPHAEWMRSLQRPTGFGWCFRCDDASTHADGLRAAGLRPQLLPLDRCTPSGDVLRWTLVVLDHDQGMAVPYFIDWRGAESPAGRLPAQCSLVAATPASPDPDRTGEILVALGLPPKVDFADHSGLSIELATPRGSLLIAP